VSTASTSCSVNFNWTYYGGGIHTWQGQSSWYTESSNRCYFVDTCEPPPGGCTIEGQVWSEEYCECVDSCPILVDTTGRGYRLTGATDGVLFDIDADGARERIGWTDPKAGTGFLAFDRNGNGVIDNGAELFGSVTPKSLDVETARSANGFDALAALESSTYGASVVDGVIDSADAAFNRLLIWMDRNHDGVSQPEELVLAKELGLLSLETRLA